MKVYLKSKNSRIRGYILQGTAFQAIEGCPLTSENYKHALGVTERKVWESSVNYFLPHEQFDKTRQSKWS